MTSVSRSVQNYSPKSTEEKNIAFIQKLKFILIWRFSFIIQNIINK